MAVYPTGSSNPHPQPPPPSPTAWDQSHDTPPSQSGPALSGTEQGNLTPPPVPSGSASGSGTTSVSTPSLDTFASNIGALITPVKDAFAKLQAMQPVEPGQFYHAYVMQGKVSGSQSAAGASGTDLVSNYTAVLNDLADGLTDIQTAARQMSQKYTSIDDLNNMKTSDLQSDFDSAQTEFSSMMSANGGSGASSPSGSSGGSGGSGSGSGGSGSGGSGGSGGKSGGSK